MPELPEVEVVKRSLEKVINHQTIKEIKINNSNLRYKVKKREINRIIGLKILKIDRRSKYLLFFFDKSIVMIVHLGMTGKFFIIRKNNIKEKTSFYYDIDQNVIDKHNHIEFIFKNKIRLIYNDVRRFGFIKFDSVKSIKKNSHLKLLGPEALSNLFNFQYFKKYLSCKKRNIKDILMDQKFVSGLGNIYVNEILFYSKVKPSRSTDRLKDFEIIKIIKNTKKILKKAISAGGSSIKDFSGLSGIKGSFQQHFSVYGRKGCKCVNFDCKKIVKKIVLKGRATFFCSKCQK